MNMCGAKTRAGAPCKQKAGWGTDHVGEGRCKLHGGGSKGRPIVHGRYSIKHKESLREKQRKFMNDPEAGNLIPELALLRALLEEYLDRFGDDMRLNHQNVGHIQGMVTDIGRLVERIARIQNQTALTVAEIQLLNVRLSDLIVKYVEHDKLENFYRELDEALGLPAGQPRQITAPGGNGNNSSVA